MNSRVFASRNAEVIRQHLGKILGLPNGGYTDIDLYDEKIAVELKTRDSYWGHKFAVHEYQISQFESNHHDKELYWAFLVYSLRKRPKDIEEPSLKRNIKHMDVWFMQWDFIKDLPVSQAKTGPYVYVSNKQYVNKQFQEFYLGKTQLFVPSDSGLEERLVSLTCDK